MYTVSLIYLERGICLENKLLSLSLSMSEVLWSALDTLAVNNRGRNRALQWRYNMCVWTGCRKHGVYVIIFSLDPSLHLL